MTAFGLATLLATGCALAQTSPTATTPSATTPPAAGTTTAIKRPAEHKSKESAATDTASAPTGAPAGAPAVAPAEAPAAATPPAAAAKQAKPAATTAGKLPPGAKVNVNTATVDQLDTLPEDGQARSKVIVTEHAMGPFKDWADCNTRTARTSLNAGVKSKIKDHVTF